MINGWSETSIRDLVTNRASSSRTASEGTVWQLNLDAIEPHSGRIHDKSRVPRNQIGPSTYAFDAGTVLYSKLRPYLNKVVVADEDGYATTELVPLICNLEKVDPHYLAYFLRGGEFLSFASNLVAGAKMPRMVMNEFWSYKIPLPPLPEQRRITAILDKADALRAKRQEALDQLDELEQSIFMEQFGDPVTNPRGWPIKPLSSLSERIQIGPFGSQLHEKDYVENGVPLINPTHIKAGKITPDRSLTVPESKYNQLTQYHLSIGDLIMGRRGEMGRCAVVTPTERGWLCGTGSLFVKPQSAHISSIFLADVISSSSIRKHLEKVAQGVTMANLNKDIVGAIPVPVPPLNLQLNYEKSLTIIEKFHQVQNASLDKSLDLFASLQHRAFRGEL